MLVAGRYEGVDERFLETEIDDAWSIGDYVLTGGELPALVVIDAIGRLLPGALGSADSAAQESFSDGLVDWPHYTRPAVGGRAARCPRCWHPAITPPSGAGVCGRHWAARGCAGRSCSSGVV